MKHKNNLFSDAAPIGMLKGFSPVPHQLEVDVVVPFAGEALPGFGEFLLVELTEACALVGRVSRYHTAGQLVSERGDAYLADLAQTSDSVPETIIRQMLRYTLKIQLLGQLAIDPPGRFQYSVGERGFASLGCRVRRPSDAALEFLCNVGLENDPTAAPLGNLAFGQRVVEGVPVKFSVDRLKGRRSFVFARAGYGKSNLIKYLVSQLYLSPPDVGLLIFDPEGEYALPDAHGRPGLVNVPGLEHRVSLYSNRKVAPAYQEIHRGTAQIDFADFPPQDIVAAFVPAEKQENVSMNLLRGMKWDAWRELVELLATDEYKADDKKVAALVSYKARQGDDVILGAIKNNLLPAIRRLHRQGAKLGKNIIEELRQNRVVIVDTSLLPGEDSLAVTGMLMRRIFQHNLRHFTDIDGPTVRCLAILEEAQTILGDRVLDDRNIFVRWVKEGRKFGLGCVLVTQQPGAIAHQIISQGDNFFVMHLLNEMDLQILQRHNAYYSDEILGFIRNEPIPGNCYFWSAPNQPFVVPVRVANFESVCRKPELKVPPTPEAPPSAPDSVLTQATAKAVFSVLQSNSRVWLYRVDGFSGKKEPGWIAFSADYLRTTVGNALLQDAEVKKIGDSAQWLQQNLEATIDTLLKSQGARASFAVLEGVTRRVWALRLSKIKLASDKKLQPSPVQIQDSL